MSRLDARLVRVRVFVSEYFCSGAWPHELASAALADEGTAMLLALVADFFRVPGCNVLTTWDTRLGPFPLDGVTVHKTASSNQESNVFRELVGTCDRAFVIAPECDDILATRRRIVAQAGGRYLGPSLAAIELCGDKLSTYAHLCRQGIPTVETRPLTNENHTPFPFPLVVKPRDGAGSQATFLIRDGRDWERIRVTGLTQNTIQQPYVPGRSYSVSVLISEDRRHIELLPVCEQHISNDGRFAYVGGAVPARLDRPVQQAVESTVRQACAHIEGLIGYVGVDLIVPDSDPQQALIVDINPRLTTSYLGYRLLAEENLAEWLVGPASEVSTIRWRNGVVRFQPDGMAETTFSSTDLQQ